MNRTTDPGIYKSVEVNLARLSIEERLQEEEKFNQMVQEITEYKRNLEILKPFLDKELAKLHKLQPETIESISIAELFACLREKDYESAKNTIISNQLKIYKIFTDFGLKSAEKVPMTDEEIKAKIAEKPIIKYFDLIFEAAQKALESYTIHSNKKNRRTLPYFKPCAYLSSANTTTSNTIVKSNTYINQIMSIPAYRGKNAPKTTILVTYERLENVQGLTPFNFTPFDRLVFDAVCTINQAAKKADKSTIFTPEMVARAMHGKADAEYMPPLIVSTVAKSLDKMMTMFIVIDATAHVKSKNVEINEFKYKGYLLPMESLHINAGGSNVDSYELLKTPFLFQYASMVGQIINIENELLNIRKLTADGRITDKYLQINIDKQILVRQLASRIDRIKRDTSHSKKKQNNIILFETLFKESGINTGGHPERLKTFIFNVLDYYQALEHIQSYNKRTASGKKGYDGIEIII